MAPRANFRVLWVLLLAASISLPQLHAYSVLSHEELIDVSWDSDIRPALLKRFPSATAEEIQSAHAYAYGGSVIQDLGYYPLGNREFTNLLHYVRSGDFIIWMLREAHDINEYSFALGALSHYAADAWGHPAVNAGVAIEYPNLRERFGKAVYYEDNPEAHLKTEFSFDVVQVAKRRYLSKQYHDFIGFKVSEDLLERAFADTYGIKADDLLRVDDLSVETLRFGVSRVIPEMTQVAVAMRKSESVPERDDPARRKFLYHLSRADYERDFGTKYRRPGVFARILSVLLRLIPKFGAFKALGYKDPTPQTEDLYFKSMDNVIEQYHRLLQDVNSGKLDLLNKNLDTGHPAQAGQYRLADEAYGELLHRLEKNHFAQLTPALKADAIRYFATGSDKAIKDRKWKRTRVALAALKQQNPGIEGLHP
jgi:hypothetical protein